MNIELEKRLMLPKMTQDFESFHITPSAPFATKVINVQPQNSDKPAVQDNIPVEIDDEKQPQAEEAPADENPGDEVLAPFNWIAPDHPAESHEQMLTSMFGLGSLGEW